MTILFGNLGDGSTMRVFGAVAAAACLAAMALGAEAERYAQVHRPALPLTSIPTPKVAGLSQARLNEVDYATTGSFEPEGQRGTCSDILGEH